MSDKMPYAPVRANGSGSRSSPTEHRKRDLVALSYQQPDLSTSEPLKPQSNSAVPVVDEPTSSQREALMTSIMSNAGHSPSAVNMQQVDTVPLLT